MVIDKHIVRIQVTPENLAKALGCEGAEVLEAHFAPEYLAWSFLVRREDFPEVGALQRIPTASVEVQIFQCEHGLESPTYQVVLPSAGWRSERK